MTRKFITVIVVSIILIFFSCGKPDNYSEISKLICQHINIPENKLDRHNCSYYNDTLSSIKEYTLLMYFEGITCASCELKELSDIENNNRHDELWNSLRKLYVFNVNPESANNLYVNICRQRIENDVFFDTCGIFRSTNPIIPDSKMFHTFVLDRENNVALVGNPFKNQKLKELLSRIVKEKMSVTENLQFEFKE